MVKEDIDEGMMDECLKDMQFEIEVVETIERSHPTQLEDNIGKLGFVKIFEVEGTKWFLYEDTSYILVLAENNKWHLYQKAMGSL